MISLGRLSDRNYGCRQRPRYLIFSQFSIGPILLPKCVFLRLCLGPHRGASSASSWQTLGLTIAEGPTELRAPGPRDPMIRHWILPIQAAASEAVTLTATNRAPYAYSCRYTVRCNRADIAVSVSWYNDIEP